MNLGIDDESEAQDEAPKSFYPCLGCGSTLYVDDQDDSAEFCTLCIARYPPSLLKACTDQPFDYALELRDERVLRFEGAEIRGDWVHLDGVKRPDGRALFLPFPRGVDVRFEDIVWCADAPEGS